MLPKLPGTAQLDAHAHGIAQPQGLAVRPHARVPAVKVVERDAGRPRVLVLVVPSPDRDQEAGRFPSTQPAPANTARIQH